MGAASGLGRRESSSCTGAVGAYGTLGAAPPPSPLTPCVGSPPPSPAAATFGGTAVAPAAMPPLAPAQSTPGRTARPRFAARHVVAIALAAAGSMRTPRTARCPSLRIGGRRRGLSGTPVKLVGTYLVGLLASASVPSVVVSASLFCLSLSLPVTAAVVGHLFGLMLTAVVLLCRPYMHRLIANVLGAMTTYCLEEGGIKEDSLTIGRIRT